MRFHEAVSEFVNGPYYAHNWNFLDNSFANLSNFAVFRAAVNLTARNVIDFFKMVDKHSCSFWLFSYIENWFVKDIKGEFTKVQYGVESDWKRTDRFSEKRKVDFYTFSTI